MLSGVYYNPHTDTRISTHVNENAASHCDKVTAEKDCMTKHEREIQTLAVVSTV